MRIPSVLLCQDVRKEITGTHTIVGQFNSLRGYLMEKYSLKVFFTITDFIGMAQLKVVVKSPEGVVLKEFYTDEIPCVSKLDFNAGFFTVTNLLLKSYGRYTITVLNKDNTELNEINFNYLVPSFKSNSLMINGKLIEVPRINYHDNKELQDYARLFLREKNVSLDKPFSSVEFISQFMYSDGIGSVSCNLINQMIKRGIKVKPTPVWSDQASVDFIRSIDKANICEDEADITIVNTLPPHLKLGGKAKRLLLFSYWEASQIDKSWVNVSNTADAVFVPSNYVKEVYENSGVEVPVITYKQPIDPVFQYIDKVISKEEEDQEYFDILFLGTCIPRKGYDIFTKAVDKVFGKDRKVRIRMHLKPWSEALDDKRREVFKKYKDNKQYMLTSNVLSTLEVVQLIQSSDLLVAPSRSEGLGLIPIQSVVCGTPAIVPDHSGFKEYNFRSGFLKIENSKIVKGEGIYSSATWYEPDFDELCSLLKYARNNKYKLREEAKEGSEILKDEYSVTSAYSTLESLINNIYIKRNRRV